MGFNPRPLAEYHVGDSVTTGGRTITETDIVIHAGQTGDFFPHHMDAEWAREHSGFGHRIAHGTLVLSVASGMLTADVNPLAFSYGYDRVRFVAPTLIGDTITVTGEIVGIRDDPKRPDRGFADEQVRVVNQRGELVMVFVHVYSVQRDA